VTCDSFEDAKSDIKIVNLIMYLEREVRKWLLDVFG